MLYIQLELAQLPDSEWLLSFHYRSPLLLLADHVCVAAYGFTFKTMISSLFFLQVLLYISTKS